MHQIEKEIEIHAPFPAAYELWSRVEQFPRFMLGVKEVRPVGENRLFWHAKILGQDIKWEAVMTRDVEQRRITWESVTGHPNRGTVEFIPGDPMNCRVKLLLEYQPLGVVEEIGDALGILSFLVQENLERFRDFIETITALQRHAPIEVTWGTVSSLEIALQKR